MRGLNAVTGAGGSWAVYDAHGWLLGALEALLDDAASVTASQPLRARTRRSLSHTGSTGPLGAVSDTVTLVCTSTRPKPGHLTANLHQLGWWG